MTHAKAKKDDTLDRALMELAVSGPRPDPKVLEALVRRFPEHAAELGRAALELTLELARGADHEDPTLAAEASSPAVAKAMARLHAKLGQPEALFELDRAKARAVTAKLGIPTPLFIKLRDRLVRFETIPARFVRALADAVERPIEIVAASLEGPPRAATLASFKADAAPTAPGTQSFEEAARSAGLDEAKIAELLER